MMMQHETGGEAGTESRGLEQRLAGGPQAELAGEYLRLLLQGDRAGASELVLSAVEQGRASLQEIYLHVFQPALYEVGRLWQLNRISVATEHYVTAATQFVMSQLFPRVLEAPRKGLAMVACCVGGELHEVGMRMVADFFELEGWDTHFLGASTPQKDIVETVAAQGADLLCISVTMSQNVHLAARIILALRSGARTRSVPVLVGGLPFARNPKLPGLIGAQATAVDAARAVRTGVRLVGQELPDAGAGHA